MSMEHRDELSALFDRYYDIMVSQYLRMTGYSSASIKLVEDCVQYADLMRSYASMLYQQYQ